MSPEQKEQLKAIATRMERSIDNMQNAELPRWIYVKSKEDLRLEVAKLKSMAI
jgi:ribosomal protein L39E